MHFCTSFVFIDCIYRIFITFGSNGNVNAIIVLQNKTPQTPQSSKHEQFARVLFFRRPIISTYEGATRWLFKLLILAWTIPTQLFIPSVIPCYTIFFLLKLEVFDSVSSLGFRDSFSAKLSRIWQIASRDSVTIFLFHETCKRVLHITGFGSAQIVSKLTSLLSPCTVILPIRLALLPCTYFEKQKKLPDPKSERT